MIDDLCELLSLLDLCELLSLLNDAQCIEGMSATGWAIWFIEAHILEHERDKYDDYALWAVGALISEAYQYTDSKEVKTVLFEALKIVADLGHNFCCGLEE